MSVRRCRRGRPKCAPRKNKSDLIGKKRGAFEKKNAERRLKRPGDSSRTIGAR